jgi:nucleolar protein 4
VNESDAKDCVRDAPKKTDPSSTTDQPKSRHALNSAPSILQNDASDPSGRYTLSTRILQVSRFLPKATADSLTASNAAAREQLRQADKRRLYLLSEGTVSPSSTLYSMLSKVELDMRSASFKQRQKLLKLNPNLGLSLTRLSVRNLPRSVGSKELKQLAREAVVGFATDVKAGKRTALSGEENRRGEEEMRELEAQRTKKGVGIVKQAKVVFEGRDGGAGSGRSRGYGFIEYWSHRAALAGLRWLNGYVVKGKVEGERGKRLIVEFAIDNAQVVMRRGEREKRSREKKDPGANEQGGDSKRHDHRRRAGGRNASGDGRPEKGMKRKRGDEAVPEKTNAKKQKQSDQKEEVDDDEKNKIAKRNRIISKKRHARKSRKN